ncbi:MAG: hypothetical protein DCF22_07585 [Leptolyngbya sp.]|nr:MAG: hypothetical protein DCF22_07585 [Leptolyngbya sp.]
MSGIINFIKNLVGGIFSFLGGFFSKKTPAIEGVSNPPSRKSKSGYFLELDDSQSAASAVTSAVLAPVNQMVEAIADSGNGAAPTQAQKSTRKEQLAAAKASNGNAASATAAKASSKPESVPVAAIASAPVSEVGFATKYPIPLSSGGRRLPGANMNSYLDMARQMK